MGSAKAPLSPRLRHVPVAARKLERGTAAFAGLADVTAVELDLDRAETLAPALAGATKVFQVSPMTEAMIPQTDALARAAGVRHVVRSSLFGAGDAQPIREGEWHAAADKA